MYDKLLEYFHHIHLMYFLPLIFRIRGEELKVLFLFNHTTEDLLLERSV
jgi:hypothetical protein